MNRSTRHATGSNHLLTLSLSAAVLASALTLSLPATAQQQGQQQAPTISTQVGNPGVRTGADVVDAVGDLREATHDLSGVMIEARENFTVTGWKDKELRLQAIQQELQQMKDTLDRNARRSDEEWTTWMSGGDYTTQVSEQVNRLGGYLSEMAKMVSSLTENQSGTPIVVGDELVETVNDLRASVSDLVDALSAAGPQFGWQDDQQRFSDARKQLAELKEELDQKANEADDAWATFIASPEFRITIHDNVEALGQIVKKLIPNDS